ncbi:MAG: hypothetical protein EBR82_32330, partial [Caulobacteraceae bacterium]|nr:hypothetical protein [Caulobacteraceae bacterium]
MLKIVLSVLCGLLLLTSAGMASAQSSGVGPFSNGGLRGGMNSMSTRLVDPLNATTVSGVIPSRLERQRQRNGIYQYEPSKVQILSSSQSQINTVGIACRVVDARLVGFNYQQEAVYEVSCGNGMGYVVGSSSPPTAVDCVTVSGRADVALREDPEARPVLCTLSGNQNVTGIVSRYAREAGVTCEIDAAAMAGVSVSGNAIYEVGCKDADGYWVEKADANWIVTPCVKVAALNSACQFTTRDEQNATLKAWLAGTPAAACDVADVRYIGANASGAFYEAKCGAGDGYVARFSDDMRVQQIYACDQAAAIGGGCRLTAAAGAPA